MPATAEEVDAGKLEEMWARLEKISAASRIEWKNVVARPPLNFLQAQRGTPEVLWGGEVKPELTRDEAIVALKTKELPPPIVNSTFWNIAHWTLRS